jgi:hypothetical protein
MKMRKEEKVMRRIKAKRFECLYSFLREEGSSMLEFAVAIPIFTLTVFGTLQMGLMMVSLNALDAGVREASRYGITGGADTGLTRAASIQNEVLKTIQNFSGGIVDTSKVNIIVKAYPTLENLGQPEPFTDTNSNGKYDNGESFIDINGNGVWDSDMGKVGSFGVGGQAVLYEARYNWNTFFPIFGKSSHILLTAQTIVVNEAF